MQTTATSEKSKGVSAVTMPKNRQQSFFAPVNVLPKLTIGAVDDPYEREADAMADRVMRMPFQQVSSGVRTANPGFFAAVPLPVSPLQRECATCNEEEKLKSKEEKPDEEEKLIHRKEKSFDGGLNHLENSVQRKCTECEKEEKLQLKSAGNSSAGIEAPSIVHDVINSGGQPLDAGTRNFFEPRFGYDFSNIKIHTGDKAAESSHTINAQAYTSGNNIVFNKGKYSPNTEEGKRLLGHELTHVVQQEKNFIQKKDDKFGSKVRFLPGFVPNGGTFSEPVTYSQTTIIKGKGSIIIETTAKIIKSPELMHVIKTANGVKRVPYEYVLVYERKVNVKTKSGSWVSLFFKADSYLPFEQMELNPQISPFKAIAMTGDFHLINGSVDGDYGNENVKNLLEQKLKQQGKDTTDLKKYLFSGYVGEKIYSTWGRDLISLKDFAYATTPKFTWFFLTPERQYDYLVDYLMKTIEGRMPIELRQIPKPQRRHRKPKDLPKIEPEPQLEVESEDDSQTPDKLKEPSKPHERNWVNDVFDAIGDFFKAIGGFFESLWNALPVSVRGILKTIGKFVAGLAAAAAIAAAIVFFFPEIAFATAFLGVAAFFFGFSFGSSLVHRYLEAKANGKVNFGAILGISLLDTFGISGAIEAFTDKSLLTGKDLLRSFEDRWEAGSTGVLTFFTTILGLRGLKGSPKAPVDVLPPGDSVPITPVEPQTSRFPSSEPPVDTTTPNQPFKPSTSGTPSVEPPVEDLSGRSSGKSPTGADPPADTQGKDSSKKDTTGRTDKDTKPKDPEEPTKPKKITRRQSIIERVKGKLKEIEAKKAENQGELARLGKEILDTDRKIWGLKKEIGDLQRGTEARTKALKELKDANEHRLELDEELKGYEDERNKLNKAEDAALESLELERPPLRESTKQSIRQAAKKNDKGEFLDINTNEVIKEGELDYGHKYGRENRRLVLEATEKGMTQEQFNDWVNNHPEWFQLETVVNNRSHRFEKPGID